MKSRFDIKDEVQRLLPGLGDAGSREDALQGLHNLLGNGDATAAMKEAGVTKFLTEILSTETSDRSRFLAASLAVHLSDMPLAASLVDKDTGAGTSTLVVVPRPARIHSSDEDEVRSNAVKDA